MKFHLIILGPVGNSEREGEAGEMQQIDISIGWDYCLIIILSRRNALPEYSPWYLGNCLVPHTHTHMHICTALGSALDGNWKRIEKENLYIKSLQAASIAEAGGKGKLLQFMQCPLLFCSVFAPLGYSISQIYAIYIVRLHCSIQFRNLLKSVSQ